MKKQIAQRNYMSTNDFVSTNGLEKEAVQLFGENWEAEDDCIQIEQLLELVVAEHFEVIVLDKRSNYDLQVKFNSDLKEIADLKKEREQIKMFIEDFNDGSLSPFELTKKITELLND